MKKFASILSAAAMAATMLVTSFAPASAGPLPAPRIAADNGVITVQQFTNWPEDRRIRRGASPRHGWQGGGQYYNGHRGYRQRRPGYRYHNGLWFPGGAFIAGAIIGGALNNATQPPRHYRRSGSAHVQWCYNRYRSYRDWDNTFQPYHGPRQQCYSPYR